MNAHFPQWFFQDSADQFRPVVAWEKESFEQALADTHNVVQYVWPPNRENPNEYEVNFTTMLQTTIQTGTTRRLLRFENAHSHAILSPCKQ